MTTDKYKNKYRIASARLPHWDYGSNGAYFVTICTCNRVHYFGEIQNGIMCLSAIGQIAQERWQEIPHHFPFVILDAFVIMPNHVHGIIVIDKPITVTLPVTVETPKLGVSTWEPGNLGVIINQYKRVCTIKSRKINPDFAWQSRFHDHIIRNDRNCQRIAAYINDNPSKWELDRNNVPS